VRGWSQLLSAVERNGTSGLLDKAIADDALPVTTEQRASARRVHLGAMSTAIALERLLMETVHELDSAGIDHRVLGGPAHAHLDWPDASLRPFQDIDLLLPVDLYDDGISTLLAAGFVRRAPEVRPGFDARFDHRTTLVTPDRRELDVHRTFAAGAFGLTIETRDLFVRATSFMVSDCQFNALGDPERFLHVCYDVALGDAAPRHVAQRDLVEIASHLDDADTARALTLAKRWRGEIVVAAAVRSAFRDLTVDGSNNVRSWADQFVPTPEQRRCFTAYAGPRRSFAKQAIEGLRVVPHRDKVAYAKFLIAPIPDRMRTRLRLR
jgi:hypothetical protein